MSPSHVPGCAHQSTASPFFTTPRVRLRSPTRARRADRLSLKGNGPNLMPIVNRIAALSDEMAEWRHDFHEHPELLYDVHRTAGIVADRLREFGCNEVTTGIGRTGVVGIIRGRKSTSGKTIGLRAD